jgi:hypothetical protein
MCHQHYSELGGEAMTRRGRAIAGAIAMLLVVPFARSTAQAHAAIAAGLPGAIVVQVTDTSLNPLPAEVVLPALGLGTRVSENGAVMLVNVPDGLYRVEVRHEGHASDSRLVRVTGDTSRADFALTPIAADRGPTDARGGRDIALARLRYFIERSATLTPGTFITRDDIERRGVRTVTALLRDIRGVQVERGAGRRTTVRSTEAPDPGCARGMLVFVDGDEITPTDDSSLDAATEQPPRARRPREAPLPLTAGRRVRWVGPSGADLVRVAYDVASVPQATTVRRAGVTDIDRLKASSVVALEIYSSPGSAPPEFQLAGAECGVVLIWTAGA